MKRNLAWYLNRLRQMDAAEIAWRVGSEVRDGVDVLRILSNRLPSVQGPLPQPTFSAVRVDSAGYRAALSDADFETLCEQADGLLRNELTFFGRTVHLGDPVNWHRDWHSQIQAPLKLSYQVDYRYLEAFGDCKEVWEPNRHHQLVVLGRAYLASGDRRYADKVAELLASWLDANPFGYGMNWRSPLELGIRLINWVWAIALIEGSGAIGPELSERLHQSAYLHCWDVARKFSQGSSANNHLIGEAAGVFIAASCWFPSESAWLDSAREILEREIIAQSFACGCTREQALSYQFFVLQFNTLCGLVGAWTGRLFSRSYWERLERQFDFLLEFRGFGGCLPFFGDKDDGYVLDLGDATYDLAGLAKLRESLSGTPVVQHGPTALLIGQDTPPATGWRTGAGPDAQTTRVLFEDAGYALLRSRDPAQAICLFDAGPMGYGAMAAHGHADMLHIAYSVRGVPFLVDSGTYDYFTYPSYREHFRSTAAHNTIRLGGQEQSISAGPFMWKAVASARLTKPAQEDACAVVGMIERYAGYEGQLDKLERRLELDSESGALTITDALRAQTPIAVEAFLHLHPDVTVRPLEGNCFRLEAAGIEVDLRFSDTAEVELVTSGPLAKYSDRYHELRDAACFVARVAAGGNPLLVTRLLPRMSAAQGEVG